jgi:hypothetical protein
MSLSKPIPQSKKLRAIVNGVSFYTTPNKIYSGVGDRTTLNHALVYTLELLKLSTGPSIKGIAHSYNGYSIQLDII